MGLHIKNIEVMERTYIEMLVEYCIAGNWKEDLQKYSSFRCANPTTNRGKRALWLCNLRCLSLFLPSFLPNTLSTIGRKWEERREWDTSLHGQLVISIFWFFSVCCLFSFRFQSKWCTSFIRPQTINNLIYCFHADPFSPFSSVVKIKNRVRSLGSTSIAPRTHFMGREGPHKGRKRQLGTSACHPFFFDAFLVHSNCPRILIEQQSSHICHRPRTSTSLPKKFKRYPLFHHSHKISWWSESRTPQQKSLGIFFSADVYPPGMNNTKSLSVPRYSAGCNH